jgi:hypothetical protein
MSGDFHSRLLPKPNKPKDDPSELAWRPPRA